MHYFVVYKTQNTREFHNVPFTDVQYSAMLQHAGVCVDDRMKDGEREVFCMPFRYQHNLI
jgi:hypothetical protein